MNRNQINELTLHEFFEMNGPDAKDNFDKLYSAFPQEKDGMPKSVTEFLAWLKVPGCLLPLLSMWLCFACDLGFKSADFEGFDVDVWNQVTRKYRKQHRLRGHCAIIAALVRRHGESP